jgi:hypothetical protein
MLLILNTSMKEYLKSIKNFTKPETVARFNQANGTSLFPVTTLTGV